MKMLAKITKGTVKIKDCLVERNDEDLDYRGLLEACLIDTCKILDIPVPLWLQKNTKEFVNFRRTFFASEQFTESVYFDRFEIKVEQ